MSAEHAVAAPPLAPAEIVQPLLPPEERFAQHVAFVRAEGDGLDVRRTLWTRRFITTGSVLGAAGGTTMTTAVELGTNAMGAAAAGVVLGAATYGVQRLREGSVRRQSRERRDDETQVAVNLSYSLLRVRANTPAGDKKDDVVMTLYGCRNGLPGEETDVEVVRRAAAYAQEAGVTKMAVAWMLAREVDGAGQLRGATPAHPGARRVTVPEWIKEKKGLAVEGTDINPRGLFEASPRAWLEIAQNKTEETRQPGLADLWTELARLQPEHPALALAKEYAASPELLREKVLPSLRGRLRHYVDTAGVVAQGVKRATPAAGEERRLTPSVHITGEEVQWHINGNVVLRKSLQAALELDRGRLEERLAGLQGGPRHQSLKTLEYALYRQLYRQAEARHVATVVRREVEGLVNFFYNPYTVQSALGEREKPPYPSERVRIPRKQRLRRAGAAVSSAAIGFGLTAVTMLGVDIQYDKVRTQAAAQLEKEHQLDPQTGEVSDAAIDRRMDEWSGANTAWRWWYNQREGWHHILPEHGGPHRGGGKSSPDDPNRPNPNVENTGNFVDKYPHVVWNLEPHNMDVTGYWMTDTSEAAANVCPGCENFMPAWDLDPPTRETIEEPVHVPAMPEPEWLDRPYTRVSRSVTYSDLRISGPGEYLMLPVLEGSGIIAANIGGNPAPLMLMKNGVVAFTPKGFPEGSMQLEYWIIPKMDGYGGTISDQDPGQTQLRGLTPEARRQIEDAFRKNIPAYAAAGDDPDKKRQAVFDYLKYEFQYSKTPFSKDEQDGIGSWVTFVKTLLDGKLGNCNLESTLLIIADPRLAAAFGYFNSAGDGELVISSGEAHMTALDNRMIVDPVSERVYVGPAKGDAPAPLTPWIVLAGLIQMTGAAVALQGPARRAVQRQHVQHMARRADRAAAELRAVSAFALHYAATLAEQTLYARDGNVNPSNAADLAARPDRTWENGRDRVMRPGFLDPATPDRLRRQRIDSSQARYIHRLATRASRRPAYDRRRK